MTPRTADTGIPTGGMSGRAHTLADANRGVAQLGSALALGARGRGFKSRHPDREHRQPFEGGYRDPRRSSVKSTVETLSPTRVRLEIEVPFAELEPSLKKAYREIGSQVSIPGFRRGKVPTAVIDQRVGRGAVLNEAVQEVIPTQILAAVREHEVKTLGRPEVEITEFTDGEPLKFTAELDVRPEIVLPKLDEIEATIDDVQIGDQ